jgi:hypothetical protein
MAEKLAFILALIEGLDKKIRSLSIPCSMPSSVGKN